MDMETISAWFGGGIYQKSYNLDVYLCNLKSNLAQLSC